MTTSPAHAAGRVRIGESEVARIGYGLGSLSRSAETPEGFAAGVALLRHALEAGVTFFDTAQFYENGLANRLLAEAFHGRRDEVVYATKVGARPLEDGPVPMTAAQKPAELRAAVEDNLRSLRTDHLDLVFMRRMDMLPGLAIPSGDPQSVPLDDQLAELAALRDEGLIGAIGLSHVTLDQVRTAMPAGLAAVSNIYNLLHRDDEPMLELAEREGIVWAPYFPLGGGGYAALPKVTDDPRVQHEADELGATPSQVGLAWLLDRSPASLVIAGTSSVQHLDENVAAARLTLTESFRAATR